MQPPPSSPPAGPDLRSRFRGCLLAGAAGDALGASVEFMSAAEIRRRFGPAGITRYAPAYGGLGRITDDTQMTLFTAEGLLRTYVRGCLRGVSSPSSVVARAYLRWLHTQGEGTAGDDLALQDPPGWLIGQPALHSCRAPGNTCLSALRATRRPGEPARNDSKGCGGVMRVAPVGLFVHRSERPEPVRAAFELGTELAALTHGHPSGSLSAGVFAATLVSLLVGASLREALAAARVPLRASPDHEETLAALDAAERLAGSTVAPAEAIERLGQGWVGEEALAISVYCALVAGDLEAGVVLAVNHGGDSDSTGAITGNLLGLVHGVETIPAEWLDPLELREVITEIADDLLDFPGWPLSEYGGDPDFTARTWKKYPGF